ncbi:TPA: hypothetical protein ACKP7M_003290, partial [Stenotrophomonas maltophilia]
MLLRPHGYPLHALQQRLPHVSGPEEIRPHFKEGQRDIQRIRVMFGQPFQRVGIAARKRQTRVVLVEFCTGRNVPLPLLRPTPARARGIADHLAEPVDLIGIGSDQAFHRGAGMGHGSFHMICQGSDPFP